MKYTYDPFSVTYDIREGPTYSYIEECILAAKKAYNTNTTKKPIAVTMSGGIDSEIVARAFLLAKIPFTAVIGRLGTRIGKDMRYFNTHDYRYAVGWCQQNKVEYKFCDIDIYKEAGTLVDWLFECKGFSPQFACHMYIIRWCSMNGYFFVQGHGETDIVLSNGVYYCTLDQRQFSIDIFCEKYNYQGVIRFYTQDQKLTAALLNLPTVKKLMGQNCPALIYKKHDYLADVFDFIPRIKYTGFENIQEWDSSIRAPLKAIMRKYDDKSWIPVEFFQNH